MQIRLELVGGIRLHDEVDVVDVDAARGDIRRDENPHAPGCQALQVARALGLVEVAMQRDGGNARVIELLREHLGVGTRAGEDERLALAVHELAEDLGLVAVVDEEDAVVDRRRLLRLARDLVTAGSTRNSSTSAATSRSSVAEKRSFWLPSDVRRRIRWTGSRKPSSHM